MTDTSGAMPEEKPERRLGEAQADYTNRLWKYCLKKGWINDRR